MQVENTFITSAMKWAYIFDVAIMDEELKAFLFKKLTRKEKYFLTSCFLEFPVEQKAEIVKRVLTAVQ